MDDLAKAAWPYVRIFGVPVVVGFIALSIVDAAFELELPSWAIMLIAVTALPTFWCGVILWVLLAAYLRLSLALVSASSASWEKLARSSLGRLQRAYHVRERFARGKLKFLAGSVYVSHLALYLELTARGVAHPLNAHWSGPEEIRHRRIRLQQVGLRAIARFVLEAGLYPSDEFKIAANFDYVAKYFQEVAIPARGINICRSVLDDGHGIMSTLTCMMYLHYFAALPSDVQTDISKALHRIPFETATLGWVGGRILEVAIYLRVVGGYGDQYISALLAPIAFQGARDIEAANNDQQRLEVKWVLRNTIRATAGLKELR